MIPRALVPVSCQYGPANDGCGDKAAVLIADLSEYAGAFADWRP